MEKRLSFEDLRRFSRSFNEDTKNVLALNAVTENGIAAVALSRKEVDRQDFTFSDLIESPDATNQERSGRCWLFSGLSMLALRAMKKLNLKTFELSEIYQMFWDKLEKANYFMETIIETRQEPLDARIVNSLLSDPISDGGQWNMFVNLIKKYGVMPKTFMPETANSSNSDPMNILLASKLREYAKVIRDMSGSSEVELREKKGELIQEFYKMLCINLGVPPEMFQWEWRDKDGVFHRRGNISPVEFYNEYVDFELDDLVSLINAPNKPFNKLYTVQYLGNMVGGQDIRYLNVDLNTMKKATVDMIKGHHAVWFGCDIAKMLQTEMGAMDLSIYDYDSVYGTKFHLDKAARLDYEDSEMTHAMVITGVDLDERGKPRKWRVENSWGAAIGDQGYMSMMDEWFDEYLFEVIVRKEYLAPELVKILDTEPVVLSLWDQMCSLARS
ncbi:MAG TPA: C1 family peptidase [Candidatus Bathyarchaeia archaeon]|nr:C1 family peptidase [Candidatus Bathyarchaeia archaeon]